MYKTTHKPQRKTTKKNDNAELKKRIKELKKEILRNKIQSLADYIKERIQKMDDNIKIALQAQLKELQEEGIFNAGYSYDIFKRLDIPWLLELVEENLERYINILII